MQEICALKEKEDLLNAALEKERESAKQNGLLSASIIYGSIMKVKENIDSAIQELSGVKEFVQGMWEANME